MELSNLSDLLEYCVDRSDAACGLKIYAPGSTDSHQDITYAELKGEAERYSTLLSSFDGDLRGKIVVLYFDNHYDHILWFWSVVLAGGIPAPCPPFSKIAAQREKQIDHLEDTLEEPLFLTSNALRNDFAANRSCRVASTDEIKQQPTALPTGRRDSMSSTDGGNLAVLMLTSGSTGKSKAVCLTNHQILAAVAGKASVRHLHHGPAFLNWVGLDHVASLVEIHLQAMYLRADQVHVHAADVVANPEAFLCLLSQHRVSRTFAPHFFLVKLQKALESLATNPRNIDLSSLSYLATGGEANTVTVAAEVGALMSRYGAPKDAIVPGFGMTETCAGAIFNTSFPSYDIEKGYEFASLGECMVGIHMRVSAGWNHGIRVAAAPSQIGDLEVSGDVVFGEYFNNKTDTEAAFTPDGWFKTGDQAVLDSKGYLCLVGRSKETININGVKYSPHEIETAIHSAQIDYVMPDYLACFSYRTKQAQTESICVVYAPSYHPGDAEARFLTNKKITTTVVLETGASPYVLPLHPTQMPKSTLGKLSRNLLKTKFEQGEYTEFETMNDMAMELYKRRNLVPPSTEAEHIIVQEVARVLDTDPAELGVETPIFDMGVTSITLIRLKRLLEVALQKSNIPMVTLMTHSTVRSLAAALCEVDPTKAPMNDASYDPVVVLQPHGTKTPLWLFHPGVGEILVFFNLAKYITDRPVYALRARGFDPGQSPFESIDEAVTTYFAAIKHKQPSGPYALAGYSYGAMLAFETAKRLEADGGSVNFLGSFNLPPHIKARMQKLVWSECLLHLAYFLDLITEDYSRSVAEEVEQLSRSEALDFVLIAADQDRLASLSLTREAFEKWVNLAFGLQSMARNYEPSGCVAGIDVFCAEPLAMVASSKEAWRSQQLSRWQEFCETKPRIHDVGGSHYTMIDEGHVFGFQKKLRKALEGREMESVF